MTAVSSPSGAAAARQKIKRMKLDIKLPPISNEMRLLLMCCRPTGIDADKEAMEVLTTECDRLGNVHQTCRLALSAGHRLLEFKKT